MQTDSHAAHKVADGHVMWCAYTDQGKVVLICYCLVWGFNKLATNKVSQLAICILFTIEAEYWGLNLVTFKICFLN